MFLLNDESHGVSYLDGILIKPKAILLIGEEFFDLQALIALELNHLAESLGFGITNDSAIAG